MLNPTKSNLISSKLEAIRSLSETISESDLTLIVQENPDSEVIANSAMKSKPKLDKKDLRTLGIVSLPDFAKAMLSRHPHQTLKVYFDFEKNSLTSVPYNGDCIEISTISIGYRNGHYGKLTKKMIEGKIFKEAMVEIIRFDLKQTYLNLSQLESFTFKDYRKRKAPLSLVDKESVKANLRRWEITSIQSLLMDRGEEDKQIIAELVKEMILDSSRSLYLWK